MVSKSLCFVIYMFQSFEKWMLDNKLLEPGVKSLFVTCGDWDLNKM